MQVLLHRALEKCGPDMTSAEFQTILMIQIYMYEVCPKSSWTSLVEVIDKHISLKAFAFHEVQHQLNKWLKFHENCFSLFGVTLS